MKECRSGAQNLQGELAMERAKTQECQSNKIKLELEIASLRKALKDAGESRSDAIGKLEELKEKSIKSAEITAKVLI